ncbi:MAG: hypothetical protein ACLRM8_09590 [Alistipes sp.]
MERYAFILLVLLSAGAVRAQRYERTSCGVRAGLNPVELLDFDRRYVLQHRLAGLCSTSP